MKKLGISVYFFLFAYLFVVLPPVFATNPSSTNYILKSYGFDSSGTNGLGFSSTNYAAFGTVGEPDNALMTSANYKSGNGLVYTTIASVPPAPSLTNPSSYYNKLLLIINKIASDASDYTYAVAISTDNFVTDTKYIQTDNTVGTSFGIANFRSYTSWGSTSGLLITGLNPGVTYTVKVKARQGLYTESSWGPTAQVATSNPTMSFSVSPNSVNIGNMTPGSIATSPTITTTTTTNGTGGTAVYVYDSNAGLKSTSTSYTISAVSSDLSVTSEGYGAQSNAISQTSGGPMEALSPYNGSGNSVGILNSTENGIFDSTNQPVTAGVGKFVLQAKPGTTARAATDYTDTLTVIASALF